jgi:hypothetical protein
VQAKAEENLARPTSSSSHDYGRLIQKLRWIGLDKEARQLECALDGLPPEERSGFNFDPADTD